MEASFFAQWLRQLGDIRRDPPRLMRREGYEQAPAPPALAQVAQHVGPPPPQSVAQPPQPCLGGLRVLWASCKPGRRAPAFSWSKT